MKLIRHACLLGGIISCLLFLSIETAYSQQPVPRGYLFVEVKDTSGKAMNDATVTVQSIDFRTDKAGVAAAGFGLSPSNRHHYELQVSTPGYLTSEHVAFRYLAAGPEHEFHIREEFPGRVENFKVTSSQPIRIALLRTPVTSAERQAAKVEGQKHRLLLAAKRGDPVDLRKLLQAGVKADTTDIKGVPAIAWAAFAGDAETIRVLLDAGADVRNENTLGHQALLIYLTEGIFRDRNKKEISVLERHEELVPKLIVRKLIDAGAGVNVRNSYLGTVLNRAITLTPYYSQTQFNYQTTYSPSIETIRALIAARANVNSADESRQTPLMAAAQTRSVEVIRLLLDSGAGASINAKDNQGQTALLHAVSGYHKAPVSEVVKVLITAGADVNAVNGDGQTALILAAQRRSVEVIKLLLESGARSAISMKDKKGQTALMYSSQSYSADVSNALIQAGASINEKDALGWTALMYAARSGYGNSGEAVVRLLIAAGAIVNDVNKDGQSPLMLGALSNDQQVVKMLLGAGASVNAKDKQGQTVLMNACHGFSPIDFELFIKAGAGASINEKDARGWTALMYAVPRYSASMDFKVLIAAGANVHDVNEDGQTVLMLAAQTGSVEKVKTLLESGAAASINAKDKQGRTALMHVKSGYAYESVLEIVKALIAAGANVNAVDLDGKTPLMFLAVREARMSLDVRAASDIEVIIKTLLEAGAPINAKDNQGRTALILAADDPRYFETITVLIKAGADINLADNDGQTALMVAAAVGGTYEIGNNQLLLTAGAKTNLVDRKGRTALTIAREAGNLTIVRLLEEAEARH